MSENLRAVRDRIRAACERAGRDPAGVLLVAVSKTRPPESIRVALDAGQRDFGENYARELREKAEALPAARWHFIGSLQTNKVKLVVGRAELIHTVDREALGVEIGRRARGAVQRVLVEVNIAREPQKGGVMPEGLPALLERLRALPALRVEGLMCMPPLGQDPRPSFRELHELRTAHGCGPELSMGMSEDYEAAIEEGATIVRVGTAIFGARPGSASV